MTTVGTLPTNLVPGGDLKGPISVVQSANNVAPQSGDMPPSSNAVPFIIATAAEDEKREKPLAAPVNGGSPVRYLQASSKLDMEPNPFEQSFSGMTGDKNSSSPSSLKPETPKPVLPPIEAISGRLPSGTEFEWDPQSLRMGPLSPSMLEGPQNPIVFEKPQNPIPVGSFPTTTASISNIFSTAPPPLADNAVPPFLEVPGSHTLPPPPAAIGSTAGPTAEPFAPNMYNPPPPQAHPLPPQPGHGDPRSQPFPPSNQPTMNQRYMPSQAPPQQGAQSAEAYGNLHLLSQAQATHREMWIKREHESNGNVGPSVMGGNVHHPHSMPHGASHMPTHHMNDDSPRGIRRSRMDSEEHSDDSDRSKRSSTHNSDTTSHHSSNHNGNKNGNSASGASKSGKKKDEKPPMDEEEKRRNFLERNRQAALKCRQRKKQWLSNLQAKVEYLTTDNEHLQSQTAALRDEIIHLKALLLAHKDCPVAQANGVYVDTISNPSGYNPQCGGMPQPGRPHHPMGPQASQQQQSPHGPPPPLPPGASLTGPNGAKPMAMSAAGAVSGVAQGSVMGHGRGPLPPPPPSSSSQMTGSSPMAQQHNMARMPPSNTSAPSSLPPASRGAMPMQAGVRY
ncbi:hypothetical protein DFQ27_004582 [Actinomortierella ambigua]|uniref:BZIP domain-containing protein n=1 Tax=Actinomortierella ambigua TaxID=1343610 RepID=A0A9P6QML1_9FUNG|nr:hypothetical protein DFQ26_004070 [Actinomortierella ambigua]KAG0269186.1 hypothetical protein DFQ27_004582 [Actinomortierella ambigua]